MRIVSGIQPTGQIHIGNYLGAIKNWVELQKENDCIFFIVDLHAITVSYEIEKLKDNVLILAADLIASGIDYKKSILYAQSSLSEHTELAWFLANLTSFGDLLRMTQFKEKSQKQKSFVSAGLLYYPVLMASDILLYKAEGVPVGEDQLQHIELTRAIAEKFNKKFGDFFPLPKPMIFDKDISRIKSLTDVQQKMSKSNPNGCIFISDSPDEIRKKFKTAITDSGKEIKYDLKKKPAISNLMAIYKGFSGKSFDEIENEFKSKQYFEFKSVLAELVIEKLKSIQKKRNELLSNKAELELILKDGANRAKEIAVKNIAIIKQKMGF